METTFWFSLKIHYLVSSNKKTNKTPNADLPHAPSQEYILSSIDQTNTYFGVSGISNDVFFFFSCLQSYYELNKVMSTDLIETIK